MGQLTANNAKALLALNINAAATDLTIEAAKASLFRVANTTSWGSIQDWFKVTLQDETGATEIIYVGVRTAGSAVLSNLLRGQEGTTARSWTAATTIVANRPTALDFENVLAGMTGRGTINSNTQDWDDLTQRGSYELTGLGTWVGGDHAPESAPASGIANVYNSGAALVQQLVSATSPPQTWMRVKVGVAWTAWWRADAAGSTTIGRSVLTAETAEAARTAIGAVGASDVTTAVNGALSLLNYLTVGYVASQALASGHLLLDAATLVDNAPNLTVTAALGRVAVAGLVSGQTITLRVRMRGQVTNTGGSTATHSMSFGAASVSRSLTSGQTMWFEIFTEVVLNYNGTADVMISAGASIANLSLRLMEV